MDLLVFVCCLVRNIIYGSSVLFTGKLTDSVNVFDVLALRFLMSFVVLWLLKSTKLLNIKVGVKELFGKNNINNPTRPHTDIRRRQGFHHRLPAQIRWLLNCVSLC